MKKYLLPSMLVLFILSCSTVAVPTGKAGETESASPSANEASASPTPIPPTATSIPTFTPTPVSRVASPENIGGFAQAMEYGDLIDEYIGMSLLDGLIYSFDYSQDGRTLALGICLEFHRTINEWNCQGASVVLIMDALTGDLIQKIEYAVKVTPASLSFSPDGKKLLMLVGNINHAFLTLLDVETGKRERTYVEKQGDFYNRPSAYLSPDGRLIAYSHDDVVDNALDMIQTSDGKILYTRENYLGGGKFSPDSTRFYSHAYDPETYLGYIFGLDLTTWQDAVRMVSDEKYRGEGWFDEISPNGKWVVFWHRMLPLFVHDLESGELVAEISKPDSEIINSISFSPDSRLMFADGAFVWDPDYVDFSPPVLNAWNTSTWEHAATVSGSPWSSEYVIFDGSGESFIAADTVELMRFTLPDADFLAARASVERYLNAVSAGDYATAADMLFLPEDFGSYQELVSNGFDPADMPAALEGSCAAQDDFPCLPLREIVLGSREPAGEDGVVYRFLVTFTAPDGSQFIASDGTDEFYILVGADGKIMSLHPGALDWQ